MPALSSICSTLGREPVLHFNGVAIGPCLLLFFRIIVFVFVPIVPIVSDFMNEGAGKGDFNHRLDKVNISYVQSVLTGRNNNGERFT
jgi:hypothetical protein